MVLTDVLETGYTVKNSMLNEKLEKLVPEDRNRIYEVIGTVTPVHLQEAISMLNGRDNAGTRVWCDVKSLVKAVMERTNRLSFRGTVLLMGLFSVSCNDWTEMESVTQKTQRPNEQDPELWAQYITSICENCFTPSLGLTVTSTCPILSTR